MAGETHERPVRSAEFRFYEELNDFLPAARRKVGFMQPFHGTPAIRDVIQAIGVPHTEVELILGNGQPQYFDYLVQPGDRISVYPAFSELDINSTVSLRPPTPQPMTPRDWPS